MGVVGLPQVVGVVRFARQHKLESFRYVASPLCADYTKPRSKPAEMRCTTGYAGAGDPQGMACIVSSFGDLVSGLLQCDFLFLAFGTTTARPAETKPAASG